MSSQNVKSMVLPAFYMREAASSDGLRHLLKAAWLTSTRLPGYDGRLGDT